MMLAEVAKVLKLHPQFINRLSPRNNQNVEQPERKVFTLPHTHTHTHTCMHSLPHTLAHVHSGNGKKVVEEWGENTKGR